MGKPRVDEVRWLFFDDNELEELQTALERIEDGGDNTTEGDFMLMEIKDEQRNRADGDSDGYNYYLRKE